MLLKVIGGLSESEFDNYVVSLVPGGTLTSEFDAAGIKQTDLGMRRGVPTLQALLRFRKLLAEYKPDVIQGWLYHGNLMASVAALAAGTPAPVVWNVRRALYGLGDDKLLTRMVIRAGAWFSWQPKLILHNANISVDQHSSFGYSKFKNQVIGNCFDTNAFKPDMEASKRIRTELGIGLDSTLVGIVGRFHPQKDYRSFVKAAAIAVKKFPETHFVLVGDNISSENDELHSWFCTELGEKVDALFSQFHLLGPRRDIPDIMAALDIYCSASANEGFPNVVGEAMSSGVACVVTDAGATGELVSDVGLVVKRRDPEALGHALCEMLGFSPEKRKALGASARQRILERYSISAICEEYKRCYLRLLS